MDKLVLIGGGGHCHSCIEVIESTGRYTIHGILDKPSMKGASIMRYPVIGTDNDIPALANEGCKFLITVGQLKSSDVRRKIAELLAPYINQLETVIASSAIVSRHSRIGRGTVIMHHAMINAGAVIGENNIINSAALIEHDSSTGDFCHVSTQAVMNGDCKLGNDVFVGSNSVLINGISIADKVIIAAGSTIHHSITEAGTYSGQPFHRIR